MPGTSSEPHHRPTRRTTPAARRRVPETIRHQHLRHALAPACAPGNGELPGLLHCPVSGRVRGDAAQMHPTATVLDEHHTYMRFSSTVSTCRKSTARIPPAWAVRKCRHVGPDRRGARSMPVARRISQTVDGATAMPSFMSSPWIRRCPQSKFSLARRMTRRAMPGLVAGVPACAACSCRTSPPPACGAKPAVSRASRGRHRPIACAVQAAPARRTRPGQPTRTAPCRHAAQYRVLMPEHLELIILGVSRITRTVRPVPGT